MMSETLLFIRENKELKAETLTEKVDTNYLQLGFQVLPSQLT